MLLLLGLDSTETTNPLFVVVLVLDTQRHVHAIDTSHNVDHPALHLDVLGQA
jgi:hypothetical protein